jgi:hypothetical protein
MLLGSEQAQVRLGDHLLRRDLDEFHLCKVSDLADEYIHRCARDLKPVTALRRVPKPANGAHFFGFWAKVLPEFADNGCGVFATVRHHHRYESDNSVKATLTG